jgi:hypothetical protein
MMNDIEVDIIPLQFVQDITCILSNGSTVILSQDDFDGTYNEDIESMIKSLDFFDSISDLSIRIDFDKVESDVSEHVTQILKRINDQSNSGM